MRKCRQCGNPLYDDDKGYSEYGREGGDFCCMRCVNAYSMEHPEVTTRKALIEAEQEAVKEAIDKVAGFRIPTELGCLIILLAGIAIVVGIWVGCSNS